MYLKALYNVLLLERPLEIISLEWFILVTKGNTLEFTVFLGGIHHMGNTLFISKE